MIQIFVRSSSKGKANLYIRLKKKGVINNAVALGISVSDVEWASIERQLTSVEEAQKMGVQMVIRDSLVSMLLDMKTGLEKMMEIEDITIDMAKTYIRRCTRANLRDNKEVLPSADEKHSYTLEEWIVEFIRQCESGERLKQRSAKMVTPGTIKSYKGTLAQLREYRAKRHKIIDWDDVTLDFYDDWRRFFINKKDENGKPKPYSPNTIGRHVKNLKIFLYAAKDMKLTTSTEFESNRFAVDHQDVENVYITEERIQEMYEADFEDEQQVSRLMELAPDDDERKALKDQLTRRTPKILNQAKDIFLVGCLTGQRVSDYKRINDDMYRTLSDGKEYIYLQQTKTGKWIYIPIDQRVKAILAKYSGRLPKIYEQDLNERIKVVGRLLGWRENAGITELKGMLQVPTQKKFYECIKTHTARRTFATNAYKRRISLSSIMVITGHSSEAMLKKYLKLDNEERAILAAAEFDRAKEVKLKIAE